MRKKVKKYLVIVAVILLGYFLYNAWAIYRYAFEYVENKSDVAIVLGAGTANGEVSPIFRERLNHAIYLHRSAKVEKLILTGGYGELQTMADSEVARTYVINKGVPREDILIEIQSKYTIENLREAQAIMDSCGFKTALLVSDPLHMKRSMAIAKEMNLFVEPSPTKSTMYRTFGPKVQSLLYETFYYTIGEWTGNN